MSFAFRFYGTKFIKRNYLILIIICCWLPLESCSSCTPHPLSNSMGIAKILSEAVFRPNFMFLLFRVLKLIHTDSELVGKHAGHM